VLAQSIGGSPSSTRIGLEAGRRWFARRTAEKTFASIGESEDGPIVAIVAAVTWAIMHFVR
jgi:hypothetical protein